MKKSIIKHIFLKCYFTFKIANKEVCLLPLIAGFIVFGIYKYLGKESVNNYIDILNAIGILTTFYLFGMEKLELTKMLKSMKKKLPPRRNGNVYTEGMMLVQTYFALIIIQVLLLTVQYILIIFNYESVFLLFMSIMYTFTSFFFSLASWHGFTMLNY